MKKIIFCSCFCPDVSLMERLMGRSLYSRSDKPDADGLHYDPMMLTKLVRNYRSHPDILAVPNRLFYNEELVASPDICLCIFIQGTSACSTSIALLVFTFSQLFVFQEGSSDKSGIHLYFFTSRIACFFFIEVKCWQRSKSNSNIVLMKNTTEHTKNWTKNQLFHFVKEEKYLYQAVYFFVKSQKSAKVFFF